jgi:hypothetical protein
MWNPAGAATEGRPYSTFRSANLIGASRMAEFYSVAPVFAVANIEEAE